MLHPTLIDPLVKIQSIFRSRTLGDRKWSVYTTRRLFLPSVEVDKVISEIIPCYIEYNRSSVSSVARGSQDVMRDKRASANNTSNNNISSNNNNNNNNNSNTYGDFHKLSESNEKDSQVKNVVPSTAAASTSSTDHDSVRSTSSRELYSTYRHIELLCIAGFSFGSQNKNRRKS